MTIDPKDYAIGPDATISDIDLDTEEVYYHGERLTNERAEQLAKEGLAEARRLNLVPGRKSLTGGSIHSPRVQFRVPEKILAAAERRAESEGVTLSVLARQALEKYLDPSR
jgi:hypothetical protein